MTMLILSEIKRDGAIITIYWNTETDTTEVWVDARGDVFGFDAGQNGALALDIAEHPFFYRGVMPTIECERTRPLGAVS